MTTSLVTGGLGVLGSPLADLLLARGERVLVLDDLSTGRRENLAHHAGSARLEVVVDTILDEHLVQRLVQRADRVFHLAAAVGVGLVASDPLRVHEVNTHGTAVVLRACAARSRTVLIASSSEVYGKSLHTPFAEDDDIILGPTVRPRWAYACSKATGEFLARAYFSTGGLPVRIARFFNAAGPRQTGAYGMVIPRFVRQALAGQAITVYGDGSQTRCFCHAADAVKAAVLLMDSPAAAGEVVNIGSAEKISILELAGLVRERAGSASPIVKVPFAEAYAGGLDDISVREPHIDKLERLTGFAPERPLSRIIDEVIAFERRCGAAA
jgi:UDP-glucose 4-epimerase